MSQSLDRRSFDDSHARSYLFAVREHYLNYFDGEIRNARRDVPLGWHVESEKMIRIGDGAGQLPRRVDVMVFDPVHARARAGESDTEHDVPWEQTDLWVGESLVVTVGRFAWNRCILAMHPAPRAHHVEEILHWFVRWFEPPAVQSEPPFLGVVHSLDPAEIDDMLVLHIDLGSAPPEALVELLGVLAAGGCRQGGITTIAPERDADGNKRFRVA